MRRIEKTIWPLRFADWRDARIRSGGLPDWSGFARGVKRVTKEALLVEQGQTCAYCTAEIARGASHIDHVYPRHHRPDLTWDFFNMVASCEGEPQPGTDYAAGTPRPPELVHCGHAKDDWYDPARFVDPRRPGCEKAFSFTGSGAVRVASTAPGVVAAQETIERLNLDCGPLRRQRRAAISAELDRLAAILDVRGSLQQADVLPRMAALQQMGMDGRYAPFAPALLDVLGQRASTLP